MLQQLLTFPVGPPSRNSTLMTPEQNIETTVFQRTGTLYILWFTLKMDLSTSFQLAFSKLLTHVT